MTSIFHPRKLLYPLLLSIAMIAGVTSCGDDEEQCTPGTAQGCEEEGRVCENVQGGTPACFIPVVIRGRVFDSATNAGIQDAAIVALDLNGAPRTGTTFSRPDGTYDLGVQTTRTADGTPAEPFDVTLRVSAGFYQTFPTPPRTALPFTTGDAVSDGSAYVIQNPATDVALIKLEVDTSTFGAIAGKVDFPPGPGGVLVVAEQGGTAVSTAVTDSGGNFTLYNVPAGDTLLDGYRAGVNVTEQTVSVAAMVRTEGVVLAASADGLSVVSGDLSFPNPGDCGATSVILVVESTFIESVARGEAPTGLRVGDVTGPWSIPDVPPGSYVVLAAFENDHCVRDPDPCMGGTTIQHIDVPTTTMVTESFKVTGALATLSPGAMGTELVTAPPTYSWEDDSSEDLYEFRLYDAFGTVVHENLAVPSVSSGTVSYTPAGVTYEDGMLYQFRVWSARRDGMCRISATEDLLGVFLYDSTPPMMSM